MEETQDDNCTTTTVVQNIVDAANNYFALRTSNQM
jgi:hypothetical protein